MGKAYSSDVRQRFVRLLDQGLSARGAGRKLLIASSTATRWAAIWHMEHRAEALPMGGDERSQILEAHSDVILALVDRRKDIVLREIVAELAARGISAKPDVVSRLLKRHGIARKRMALIAQGEIGKTYPSPTPSGGKKCRRWMPGGWSSSMKAASTPR